ncbi:MAG: YbjN domain-containing protein [Ruminococcus sp.]|nr:YbjN domain-containing protein [Ruminococcus sp.]
MYNKKIANAIHNFLKEDDWHFSFDEQKGSFRFGLSLKGKLRNVKYSVHVREDDYSVYVTSPLSADADDKDMIARMSEFICRANYGLIRGSFELDVCDGEIQFKFYVPCNGSMPSDKTIGESIYIPSQMFKKYGEGIVNIIFRDTSAEEAIMKCENSGDNRVRRLIQQLIEEDEDATPETIMARLMERLGSEELGGDEDEDSDDIKIKTDIFGNQGGDE